MSMSMWKKISMQQLVRVCVHDCDVKKFICSPHTHPCACCAYLILLNPPFPRITSLHFSSCFEKFFWTFPFRIFTIFIRWFLLLILFLIQTTFNSTNCKFSLFESFSFKKIFHKSIFSSCWEIFLKIFTFLLVLWHF